MNNWGQAIGGIAIAAAIAFGCVTLGSSLIDMRSAGRLVTVKGLAERDVEANLASWRIPYRGVGGSSAAALDQAERGQQAIAEFLESGGVPSDEISFEAEAMRIERTFLQEGGVRREVVRYVAVGAVRVRTPNVEEVAALSSKTRALLDAGVLLGEGDYAEAAKPDFLYTELNSIKPELISEATKAAFASAEQFAEDSGAAVGDIASADQGVIQILPRDGQMSERRERYKRIRIVSTFRYYLRD